MRIIIINVRNNDDYYNNYNKNNCHSLYLLILSILHLPSGICPVHSENGNQMGRWW